MNMLHKHKEEFLQKHIKTNYSKEALPSDASPRTYERIKTPNKTYILMDASQVLDSVQPFIQVGEFLYESKYSAPKILAKDEARGLLLLEDLGVNTYNKVLQKKEQDTEYVLYKKAVDVLVALHKTHPKIKLPEYTKKLLEDEAVLLVDYYIAAMSEKPLSEALRKEYITIWDKILDNLQYKHSILVLRDYHIDNLMWLEDRSGLQRVGLLDFQDAVIGSFAYDLVSLLEDARYDVPANIVRDMIGYYLENMPTIDRKKFMTDYAILGTQRSCKIVGVFARKATRDKDARYLKFLPRTWSYIRANMSHPLLEPLKEWFAKIDLPSIRDEA